MLVAHTHSHSFPHTTKHIMSAWACTAAGSHIGRRPWLQQNYKYKHRKMEHHHHGTNRHIYCRRQTKTHRRALIHEGDYAGAAREGEPSWGWRFRAINATHTQITMHSRQRNRYTDSLPAWSRDDASREKVTKYNTG